MKIGGNAGAITQNIRKMHFPSYVGLIDLFIMISLGGVFNPSSIYT